MKFLPIVFLLAVVCLAVAAGEARGEICNSQRTPPNLVVRRTPPGQTATTTTTAIPTTVTTTSSPKSTTTTGPSTTTPTTTTTTTTMATTTPWLPLFNCSVSGSACGNMCGHATSATTGVVQSPNFPDDYGNEYRYCDLTITAPAEWMIQLKFTTFNLENDKASILGNDGLAYLPLLTGNTIPAVVPTTTNKLPITFQVSDRSEPNTAIYNWQATFSVTSQGSACSVYNPECPNMCANVTSAGSGVVQSPNFPGDYGNYERVCGVTIIVPAGKKIQLKFTTFNLETDKGFITVNDRETAHLSWATGSSVPAVVTTTFNIVYLHFVVSASTKPRSAIYNWQATYTAVTV